LLAARVRNQRQIVFVCIAKAAPNQNAYLESEYSSQFNQFEIFIKSPCGCTGGFEDIVVVTIGTGNDFGGFQRDEFSSSCGEVIDLIGGFFSKAPPPIDFAHGNLA
jgi:hypothetical protein